MIDLRILVVDDESLVRENVINILKNLGISDIYEAQDGFDALRLLGVINPDVVIADIKMPEMDGIELLSRSREINKDIIFILLSGYDLFEYAQKAIQYGAFSYLLKPVNDNDLKTVIDKAKDSIMQKNKQREFNSLMRIGGTQGADFLKNRFISELIKGNFNDENYYKTKLKELNISFAYESFQVILISIDNFSTLSRIESQENELFMFSIENIAAEILGRNNVSAYPFDLDDGKGFLLNLSPENSFTDKPAMLLMLEEILKSIESCLNITVTIGIGLLAGRIEDLSVSYFRAQESISQRLAKGGNKIYFLEESPASKESSTKISFRTEQDFMAYFEKCDYEGTMNLIVSLYKPFKRFEIIDLGDLHKLNFQLILLIYKIMNTLGFDSEELLGDEFVLYNHLNAHHSIDAIISSFGNQLEICFENIRHAKDKGNKKTMEISKAYIAANYNKDITLESISDNVHLSAAYFSRQFKNYFGENFVDYLINYRINKAKEFLKEGIYKANEVSKMIGFNDEKYFYKVFKKHSGFTPTEYKDIYKNTR
ncbi:MAG: response regulator transcription factor [Saccharofermentanales bacterium]